MSQPQTSADALNNPHHDDPHEGGAEGHHHDPAAKLTRMANQIGTFFAHQVRGPGEHDAAVEAIVKHLKDFWDPRMRRQIRAHLAAGGAGLDPLVRDAIEKLGD